MQQAMRRLGNDLGNLGDSPFAKHLRTVQVLGTASMFGQVPEGSPISYQQPLTPHGAFPPVGHFRAWCTEPQ
ncbi:unnamed protein product [Ixodes pacificus]